MVLLEVISEGLSGLMDTVQKKTVGNINKTIKKKITKDEQKALDIIATIRKMAFKSIGSKISQITSLLPLAIQIGATFYNLPLDLYY